MINNLLNDMLINIQLTNYVCLSLLILLSIQIFFKFLFKTNIKLNLSVVLGVRINENLENLINKIIICFYDGKISYSYWLGDYESVEGMILDCLKSIKI